MAFQPEPLRQLADHGAESTDTQMQEVCNGLSVALDRVAELETEAEDDHDRLHRVGYDAAKAEGQIKKLLTAYPELRLLLERPEGSSVPMDAEPLVVHLQKENAELRAQLAQHQPRVYDPADESTKPTHWSDASTYDRDDQPTVWVWLPTQEIWAATKLADFLSSPMLWAPSSTPPHPTPELLAELAAVTARAK